jgi:hypothetical protein
MGRIHPMPCRDGADGIGRQRHGFRHRQVQPHQPLQAFRPPAMAVAICAEGVIWTSSAMGSCFCTAAPNVQVQNTPKDLSRKRDMSVR